MFSFYRYLSSIYTEKRASIVGLLIAFIGLLVTFISMYIGSVNKENEDKEQRIANAYSAIRTVNNYGNVGLKEAIELLHKNSKVLGMIYAGGIWDEDKGSWVKRFDLRGIDISGKNISLNSYLKEVNENAGKVIKKIVPVYKTVKPKKYDPSIPTWLQDNKVVERYVTTFEVVKTVKMKLANHEMNAQINFSDFSGSLLEKARFTGAEVFNTKFHGVVAPRIDMRFTMGDSVDFSYAQAFDADFRNSWLGSLDFRMVLATSSDFSNSKLPGADFRFSDVNNCNFRNSNLAGSYFFGANVEGSSFENADVSRVNFIGVKGLTCSKLQKAKNWTSSFRLPSLACGENVPEVDSYEVFKCMENENVNVFLCLTRPT